MDYAVIWNPGAGKAAQLSVLREQLSGVSTQWVEMTRDVDLGQTIESCLDSGCTTLVAAGGDGTVNAVVNTLMQLDSDRRPNLAVIPLGTANDFAGTLKIPDDLSAAAQLVLHTEPVPCDVVQIRGRDFERHYANIAAGGNCVRVSEELTDEIKERWGAFCYLRGAVGVLADMESYRISAEIDDEHFSDLACWAVLVANGRTNAGRIEVAPRASPVDGLIDVVLIRDGGVVDMLEIVAANLKGEFDRCEQVIYRQASRFRLHSEPPMRFTVDGEVVDQEPIEFHVDKRAIRMFVGDTFDQTPVQRSDR